MGFVFRNRLCGPPVLTFGIGYLYPLNCLTGVSSLSLNCLCLPSVVLVLQISIPTVEYHTEFMDMGLLAHFQLGSAFISFGY